MSESKQAAEKQRSRWRWLKRGVLALFILIAVLCLLGWMFLPRIAEKVMLGMLADAELEKTDFQVRTISWNSAVIEKVDFADGIWQLTAETVTVDYDPFDLFKGRMDQITLQGGVCEVNYPDEAAAEEVEESEPSESQDETPTNAVWIHQLPQMVERIGGVKAEALDLTIRHNKRVVKMSLDASVNAASDQKFAVALKSSDFRLNLGVATKEFVTEVSADLTEVMPDHFLHLLETVLDTDGRILPEGFTVGGAELTGGIRCEGENMEPLQLSGSLQRVKYDGGGKPVQLETQSAQIQLSQDFDGAGFVLLSGGLDAVSLPLDPSAGFELNQPKGSSPTWQTRIEWGVENPVLTGKIQKFALAGTYNERPVELNDIQLDLVKKGGSLTVKGVMSNSGTRLPLSYHHVMNGDDRWELVGEIELGPVKHTQPMPLLSALTDLFDDYEMRGGSHSKFNFKAGAYLPFEGVLATSLKDVTIKDTEGLVAAEGLSGIWKLHLIPLTGSDPAQPDPSYYTLDLSCGKLHINSKESLDFDLDHQGESPVAITGKGRFGGDVAVLDGVVKNLNLHAENEGVGMDLSDTEAEFHMEGDKLTATGTTVLKENTLPFSYQHVKKNDGDSWLLTGTMEIKAAELKNPVDNAAIMIAAMKDKSLKGRVAMKMDFTKGSEKDFDGVLTADIENGTLTFTTEDGPVIEGIKGGVRLTSMKTKQTAGFHRVTATKMTAFDMTMTNLRADYQLLPNGDIKLRNVATRALGGDVWVDPFVLPDGDANYQFKVRMKRIDIAEMAKLFPDFNGKISGRIDGLLPMQSINGDFMPQRGGMYLTPGSRGQLRYDAGTKFSGGLDPKGREYQQMKMVEDSLKNLELRVLSIRLFDPRDKDKAVVLRLEGRAPTVQGSPPIILNVNGFKPDDDTVDFFDLLLKHRDKLNFGL